MSDANLNVGGASLSRGDVLRVAAESETDPRTVMSYLDGRPVRRTTARAIAAALRAIGCEALIRTQAA